MRVEAFGQGVEASAALRRRQVSDGRNPGVYARGQGPRGRYGLSSISRCDPNRRKYATPSSSVKLALVESSFVACIVHTGTLFVGSRADGTIRLTA